MNNWKKVWTLLFDIIVFTAAPALKLLDDTGTLHNWVSLNVGATENAQIWVFGISLVAFLGKRILEMAESPKRKEDISLIRRPVEFVMKEINTRYCQFLESRGIQPVTAVRMSIMLPTKPSWFAFWSKEYLKIYFETTNFDGNWYPQEELDMRWKTGIGCCGVAYQKHYRIFFDSTNDKYSAPIKGLNSKQLSIPSPIGSIVSFPVLHPITLTPVAVLNLDSEKNIESTLFDNPEFLGMMDPFLSHLGHILKEYRKGVK